MLIISLRKTACTKHLIASADDNKENGWQASEEYFKKVLFYSCRCGKALRTQTPETC